MNICIKFLTLLPTSTSTIYSIHHLAQYAPFFRLHYEAYKNRINTIVKACSDAGITNITKLDLSNIANVRIVLDGRITFVLGTITDLNEKLSLALRTMEAEYQNSPDAKIIIDVTDTERSYVRDDYSPVEDEYETELREPETDFEPAPEPEDIPEETPAEPENNEAEAVG